MKVLLVSANRSHQYMPVMPLGIGYLLSNLAGPGRDFAVLDLTFSDRVEDDVSTAVDLFDPDVIGVSIRNVDNALYLCPVSYLPYAKEVVSACRRLRPEARIVIGGSGFSIMPAEILEYMDLDLGVVGYGERTMDRLLDAVAARTDPSAIPGVASLREGRFRLVEGGPPGEPKEILSPERSFIDMDAYADKGGMTNLQAKRGCTFGCLYCNTPLLEGNRFVLFAPERVADEIEFLAVHYGVEEIYFTDSIFNFPPSHAGAVCEALHRRRLGVRWISNVQPRYMDGDLVSAMKRAGCSGIGCDVNSTAMIRSLRQDYTVEEVRRLGRLCADHEISFFPSLLLGGPGESMATVEEALELLDELETRDVFIVVGIRVYKRTGLHTLCIERGLLDPRARLLEPVFYLSRDVQGWIETFIAEACRSHPGWNLIGLDDPSLTDQRGRRDPRVVSL